MGKIRYVIWSKHIILYLDLSSLSFTALKRWIIVKYLYIVTACSQNIEWDGKTCILADSSLDSKPSSSSIISESNSKSVKWLFTYRGPIPLQSTESVIPQIFRFRLLSQLTHRRRILVTLSLKAALSNQVSNCLTTSKLLSRNILKKKNVSAEYRHLPLSWVKLNKSLTYGIVKSPQCNWDRHCSCLQLTGQPIW